MSKIKFQTLIESFNEAPTGGFVGLTDYHAKNGDIISCTGRLGLSYSDAKAEAIKALQAAIEVNDFEAVTVKGKCYWDDEKSEWNPRKRSKELKEYEETFDASTVQAFAEEILEAWQNPKERANNKVQLTEKENGLSYNKETGSFNFNLIVDHETYKGHDDSIEKKEKAKAPDTAVKEKIRRRFEKKIKAFTIEEGKFASLTIGGAKYFSDEITF